MLFAVNANCSTLTRTSRSAVWQRDKFVFVRFTLARSMQRWEDGPGYIFLESPDDQEELASYLKDREAEGVKSVHFYFPNDLDASTQTTNHMVVDVAGFSSGVATFTSRCEQAQ